MFNGSMKFKRLLQFKANDLKGVQALNCNTYVKETNGKNAITVKACMGLIADNLREYHNNSQIKAL